MLRDDVREILRRFGLPCCNLASSAASEIDTGDAGRFLEVGRDGGNADAERRDGYRSRPNLDVGTSERGFELTTFFNTPLDAFKDAPCRCNYQGETLVSDLYTGVFASAQEVEVGIFFGSPGCSSCGRFADLIQRPGSIFGLLKTGRHTSEVEADLLEELRGG